MSSLFKPLLSNYNKHQSRLKSPQSDDFFASGSDSILSGCSITNTRHFPDTSWWWWWERGGGKALCNGSCGLGMMPNRFHSWVPPQSALSRNCGLALFHECLMRVTETKFDFTCGGCILKTLRKHRKVAHDWNMSGRLHTCDPSMFTWGWNEPKTDENRTGRLSLQLERSCHSRCCVWRTPAALYEFKGCHLSR